MTVDYATRLRNIEFVISNGERTMHSLFSSFLFFFVFSSFTGFIGDKNVFRCRSIRLQRTKASC